MAKGKRIEYSDIIDPSIVDKLKSELGKVRDTLEETTSGAGNIKEVNKALTDTIEITEDLLRLEKNDLDIKTELAKLRIKGNDLTAKERAQKKVLQEQLKQNNRAYANEARLVKQTGTSYNQLSQQLAKNRIRYRELTEEQRKNKNEGGKLLKTIAAQDKQLKKIDATMGEHQRNVGNYTSALAGQASQFGILGTAMMQVTRVFNLVKIGFRSLNAAIASTGIGLLIVAIASLVGWFKKTVAGGEAFQRVMAPLKAILQVVTNVVVELGGAIAKLFTGDFTGAIDQARDAFTDLNGQLKTANAQFKQLAELTILNKIQTGDWAIKQAQLNKRLQEARLLARDEEVDLKKRMEASKLAMTLEDELAEGRKTLIKQRIAMIVLNEQAGKSNQDEINERKQLTAELIQVEADQAQRKVRLITYLTTLQNKYNASLKDEINVIKQVEEIHIKSIEEKQQTNEEWLKEQEDLLGQELELYLTTEEEKRKAAEATAQFQKLKNEATLAETSNLLATTASLFREDTAAYKILATAQATIATYLAGTKALSEVPFPANILAMAGIILTGLANVAKINEVKFAAGTDEVTGGIQGKDSVRASLMPGERVVPTDLNRPLLAMGITNADLPGLAYLGKAYANEYPTLTGVATKQLQQALRTNDLLGRWRFYDNNGNEIDVNGNKKIMIN